MSDVACRQPSAPAAPFGASAVGASGEFARSYFGARYLASDVGRFTTVDPVYTWKENLVDPQRWNRYVYVRNNPLRYTDPDGRCIWDLCVGEGTAAYFGAIALAAAATAVVTAPPVREAARSSWNGFVGTLAKGVEAITNAWGTYRPDRELPRDSHGVPLPEKNTDGTPAGAHTQLGKKSSGNPTVGDYTQGREFDGQGGPVKDVDFTDHGRPQIHPNPHEHPYDRSKGAPGQRGAPQPLKRGVDKEPL